MKYLFFTVKHTNAIECEVKIDEFDHLTLMVDGQPFLKLTKSGILRLLPVPPEVQEKGVLTDEAGYPVISKWDITQ
jgi:hypothetical protein